MKFTKTSSSGLVPPLEDLGWGNVLARGGGLGLFAFADRSRRSIVEGVKGRMVLTGDEVESIIEQVDEGDLLIGCVLVSSVGRLSRSGESTCNPSRGAGDFGGVASEELRGWMTDRPENNDETCPRMLTTRPLLGPEGSDSGRRKGSCILDEENRVGMLTLASSEDIWVPALAESPFVRCLQYFLAAWSRGYQLAADKDGCCLYASALVCCSSTPRSRLVRALQ
jgi:hypothetical protein